MQNKSKNKYCFLKGKLTYKGSSHHGNPHYDLIIYSNNFHYQVNINVKSKQEPSGLKYYIFNNEYKNPIVDRCMRLTDAVHSNLITGLDGYCLDYLRGNLFDINCMNILPINGDNEVTELEQLLANHLEKTLNNDDYRIGIWGISYQTKKHEIIGIHDIHMNQGNSKNFINENGIWQDGGLAIYDVKNKKVIFSAFFMFQSQCLVTDNFGYCLNR